MNHARIIMSVEESRAYRAAALHAFAYPQTITAKTTIKTV